MTVHALLIHIIIMKGTTDAGWIQIHKRFDYPTAEACQADLTDARQTLRPILAEYYGVPEHIINIDAGCHKLPARTPERSSPVRA